MPLCGRLLVSRKGPQSPLPSGPVQRLETVFPPPIMTNALHEVLTRGQNRRRNGGSSTGHLASRIALLKDGKVVLLGPPDDLLKSNDAEASAFADCLRDPDASERRS